MRETFFTSTMTLNDILYAPIEPYKRNIIDVGDGHKIYIEECGRPDGKPVLVLHGGPGGGCQGVVSASMLLLRSKSLFSSVLGAAMTPCGDGPGGGCQGGIPASPPS